MQEEQGQESMNNIGCGETRFECQDSEGKSHGRELDKYDEKYITQ